MELVSIIKYEGDNSTFIWKHPKEDFNIGSQLIVHESQEAIFFMNGQALDLFGPGKYTLTTENLPILNKIINIPTDGKSPFHCEVYFINKTLQMAIRWGTNNKIQFMEPVYKFPLEIGLSGEMNLKISDSRKILINLVGTEEILTQSKLTEYFRAFINTRIKTYVSKIIKENNINIFEIDEQLDCISKECEYILKNDFEEYGVLLEKFLVTTVVKPDGDDNYERFKNLHFKQYADIAEANLRQQVSVIDAETESKKTIIDSNAQATKRKLEGYTYQQERSFDVAQDMANNESIGQYTNMGIGLGTMMGVGSTVGQTVSDVLEDNLTSKSKCFSCGAIINSSKFCPECGKEQINHDKIRCPKCDAFIDKSKFCPECGYNFNRVCSFCGASVNDSKFCPECGKKM